MSSPPTRWRIGDADAAFDKAAHVFHEELWQHRGAAHPIEGRGILARMRATTCMTVWASTQKAHDLFQSLTALLDFDESRLRVATPDVGGGFGPKLCVYPEDIAVVAAAKLLRRSIKWIEDRREHFTNAAQERDQYWSLDIAVDADARLLGVRGRLIHDLGAYALQDVNIPFNSASMMSGPYMLPALSIDVTVAATNKTPVSSVRGAGYPQAAFAMERLMDRVARELQPRPRRGAPPQSDPGGEDALHQAAQGALRRQHAVRQRRLSGLPGARCCRPRGWDDFPQRQAAARRERRYIGIGLAHGIKGTGRGPFESGPGAGVEYRARLGVHRRRRDRAGAGHRAGADLRRASSACAPQDITVVPGDTGGVSLGLGAFASRQTVTAGSSVLLAARAVAEKAKKLASHVLEAAEHDLEIADGEVRVVGAPQLAVKLGELARILKGAPGYGFPPDIEPGLEANVNWRTDALAYANACHVAEVEVDPETGGVRILNYVALQDSGMLINPMLVDGQVRGRRGARHRQRDPGMDGLRRERPAHDHDIRRLSAAGRHGSAGDRDALQGDAVAAQSARRQGRGRGQHHPDRGRDHLRHRGCVATVRCPHRADTDHAAQSWSSSLPMAQRLEGANDRVIPTLSR